MSGGDTTSLVAGLPPAQAGRAWQRVAPVDDIDPEEGTLVGSLPPVAVFADGGEFFGLDDTCTHETYSLAEGWVEDGTVECTLHAAKFDLRTGEPLGPPAFRPVRTHPTGVVDGVVFVALPDDYLVKR